MMTAESRLESFFKPEIRKSGEDLAADESVVLSSVSDTAVRAMGRGINPVRVNLASASISDPAFTAECTCTSAQKGALCKHIWATIVLAVRKHADFLDAKTTVRVGAAAGPSPQAEKRASMKEKQSAYRKEQYQKQKARVKEMKGCKTARPSKFAPAAMDPEVQEALTYFEQNGFTFEVPVDEDALSDARKQLARIFHPDKGGTHEESVELNRYYDVLAGLT